MCNALNRYKCTILFYDHYCTHERADSSELWSKKEKRIVIIEYKWLELSTAYYSLSPPLSVSLCLPCCLSLSLSLCLSSSLCLSVSVSVSLSLSLSPPPSVSFSVPVSLFVCLYVCLSVSVSLPPLSLSFSLLFSPSLLAQQKLNQLNKLQVGCQSNLLKRLSDYLNVIQSVTYFFNES